VRFTETKLRGAYIIDIEKREDNRGFFARGWCQREAESLGLISSFVQTSVSFSNKKGTLRGMHYQLTPYEEIKLVRCTRGALYDVIIDLRPDSSTYRQWVSVELTAENYRMLYVPGNFSHGFLTLEDNTEASYQISQFYSPGAGRGVRYDDPAFGIEWPIDLQVISDQDRSWPDYLTIHNLEIDPAKRIGRNFDDRCG
jgi:dTDP-4-dehydrorhamnose 3,5-epimerase